jgi:hypothetical protein
MTSYLTDEQDKELCRSGSPRPLIAGARNRIYQDKDIPFLLKPYGIGAPRKWITAAVRTVRAPD